VGSHEISFSYLGPPRASSDRKGILAVLEAALRQVVVIGGGHAGIVPIPRLREAERGSGGLNVPSDRREASIPQVRAGLKGLQ
jgi:hypothetical protein